MRVLGDWVNELLAGNGAPGTGAKALEDALGSDDGALRERAAELLIPAIVHAKPGARSIIIHMLQVAYWPPTPGMAARGFQVTFPVMETVAEDAPEAADIPLLWANLARVNPDVASSVGNALMHESAQVRRAAASAVGRMGQAAREHMGQLARLLADSDPKVSETALESLSTLGPLDLTLTLGSFRNELRTATGQRRFLAMSALRGLLEHARIVGEAIPREEAADEEALFRAAADSDDATRLQAVGLLGFRSEPSAKTESTLQAALKDPHVDVAAAAAIALLRLDRGIAGSLALLQEFLMSPDRARHDAAVYALEPLDIPLLVKTRPTLETVAEKGQGIAKEVAIGLLLRLQRAETAPPPPRS